MLLMRNLSGSIYVRFCDGKDLRNQLVEQRKAVVDSSPSIDGDVSMDDFLENFRARYISLFDVRPQESFDRISIGMWA